jgi:hypothetical protein
MTNHTKNASDKKSADAKAVADTKMDVPTLDTSEKQAALTAAPPADKPTEPSYSQADVDRMIEMAFSRWARNNPAATQRPGARDAELTAPVKSLDVPVDGRLEDLDRPDLILEAGGEPLFEGDSSKARELAFMEEYIDILVAESTNPNDQPLVPLWVNGRPQWLLRGQVTRVKRHYADRLGRARNEDVKVSVAKNADGEVVNRTSKPSALAFPFSVVEDKNPLGKAWLAKLMRGH